MNNSLDFVVIGCGNIGKRHATILEEIPEARLIGLCDSETSRRNEMKSMFPSVPVFEDYKAMLSELKPNIVNIATPHHMHAEMAIWCLKQGFNVIVEKPMALSTKDCLAMNEAAYKNNKRIWVIKQNRYNKPIRMLKEVIDQGKLGKVFLVQCNVIWNRHDEYYTDSDWRGSIKTEGGALFTQASHFIDLLIWYFGEIKNISGWMQTRNHDIEIEDVGCSTFWFEDGGLCTLNWTTCAYKQNYEGSIVVVAENGTVKIGGKYLNKIDYWSVEDYPLDPNVEYDDKPNAYGKYMGTSSNHDQVFKSIIEHYNTSTSPFDSVVDGFEGMKSVQAIENIYQVIKNLEPEYSEEFANKS